MSIRESNVYKILPSEKIYDSMYVIYKYFFLDFNIFLRFLFKHVSSLVLPLAGGEGER